MLRLIQIQTTSKCSGRCLLCPYYTSWHKNNPGYMSNDDFEFVLQRIKEFEPNYSEKICPYLMQDPLSDDNLIERIKLIFEYFPKAYIEISTNAILLTPKLSKELVEVISKYDKAKRSEIWISHHAIDLKSFKMLMQRKSYAKTLNNIIEYLLINNGEIHTWLKGSGGSADGSLFYFSQEDYLKYWQNIFNENQIKPDNINIGYFLFHNRAGNLNLEEWKFADEFNRTIDKYHSFSCWRYANGLHIMYNLDIIPCCNDYQHEYVWGNLKTQTIKEIWKSKERNDFIDKATGLKESDNNFICKKCMVVGG